MGIIRNGKYPIDGKRPGWEMSGYLSNLLSLAPCKSPSKGNHYAVVFSERYRTSGVSTRGVSDLWGVALEGCRTYPY